MNYADIKGFDVANGPGIRVSLFVSGCNHRCKGCFNQEAWDFNYGTEFTTSTIDSIIEHLKPEYIKGLSLLGGEPFEPANQSALVDLLERVKLEYPDKSIWCYTGFSYENDLLGYMGKRYESTLKLLDKIDILVDGKFIEEKKDLMLRFRGSKNQRIINVPLSLKTNTTVLWDEEGVINDNQT